MTLLNPGIGFFQTPYSDTDAVAAVRDAAGYSSDQTFVPAAILGTTPGTATSYRLVTTPVLPAGIYAVTVLFFITGTNSGTNVGVSIAFDGVSLPVDFLSEAIVPSGSFIVPGTFAQDWTAGDAAHTIEYLAWQPGGPGSLTAQSAVTTWERKS